MKRFKMIIGGEFSESGFSGSIRELVDGEYEIMNFWDAQVSINKDDKFSRIDSVYSDNRDIWDGDEFSDYAMAKIFSFYDGYEVEDGVYINGRNCIIEDDFGNKYTFAEMRKLSKTAEDRYNELYEEIVASVDKNKLKEIAQSIEEMQIEELEDIDIEETVINNYRHEGKASRRLLEDWEELDRDDVERLITAMDTAHRRHTETDYDSVDKSGLTDEQVSELRRDYNRKCA